MDPDQRSGRSEVRFVLSLLDREVLTHTWNDSAGKPSSLTAFGLVSTNSSQNFVPFNQSSVTVADILTNGTDNSQPLQCGLQLLTSVIAVKILGANDTQVADAYTAWIQGLFERHVPICSPLIS